MGIGECSQQPCSQKNLGFYPHSHLKLIQWNFKFNLLLEVLGLSKKQSRSPMRNMVLKKFMNKYEHNRVSPLVLVDLVPFPDLVDKPEEKRKMKTWKSCSFRELQR